MDVPVSKHINSYNMKISAIFLPFQLVLETATALFKRSVDHFSRRELIPVRIKQDSRLETMISRKSERRFNQGMKL